MEAWRQLLTPQQQKVFETWLEMNEDTISRLDLSRAQNQGWIVKDRCGSAMMGNRGGGTLAQELQPTGIKFRYPTLSGSRVVEHKLHADYSLLL